MAGKVNTRFVVLLSVGLAAVCGLMGWAAWNFAFSSGTDHIRNGDIAMANGEYTKAKMIYGKAVSKDPTRVEWLEKWLSAIVATTPKTETDYRDTFYNDYFGALNSIAQIQRTNIEAHDRVLAANMLELDSGFSRGRADAVARLATEAASFFDRDPSADPRWKTLLRYRGIAREQILSSGGVMPDDEVALIGEDLRAALEANPSDSRAMISLIRWMIATGTRNLGADDFERAQEVRAEAIEAADAYLAEHPDDAAVAAIRVLTLLDYERIAATYNVSDAERTKRAMEALAAMKPEVAELEQMIRAQGVEATEISTLVRLQTMEAFTDPGSRLSRTRDVVRSFMEDRPDDLELRWFAAGLDREAGDLESASERYESMSDLPMIPVSSEGFKRFNRMRQAWLNRALIELDLLAREDESAESDRLDTVIGLRERLRASVSEDNVMLLLIDGRVAEAQGKRNEALRLYKRFNELSPNANPDALRFEARMAAILGQMGTARDALERLLAVNSNDFVALVSLADIQARLNETRSAAELYRRALVLSPDNAIALEGLRRVQGMDNPDLIEDPAMSLLMRSRKIASGGDGLTANPAGAADLLVEGLESVDYDPRVAAELMRIRLDQGDIAGARMVGEESFGRHPDDEQLPRLLSALEGTDAIEVLERIIMGSDEPELVKYQRLAGLYFSRNVTDKIDGALEKLEELAPNDTQTIEMSFVRSIGVAATALAEIEDPTDDERNELFARSRELAERATAQNLDFVKGLSYQARLADAEGREEDSVALLRQAAAMGTGDASIYRLLGMSLRGLGQTAAAVAAFEQALAIRPDEIQTITEYVGTLAEAGQFDAALDVARRQQRFGQSNPAFVQLWLSLEAVAGGDEGRTLAITQREQLLEANPSDVENRYALTALYIADENWDAAKVLVDGLIAERGELRATELLATWYANQGRVGSQDGLLLANQAYQRYVRGLGDSVTSRPFISLAQFMVGRGRQDLAVRAADQAIGLEDPATLEGTKLKGELLMSIGQSAGAAAEFEKVIDAGLDDEDGRYRLRLVEMYLRTRQYEEAQAILSEMPASNSGTLTNLLQRAEIAKGLEDFEGERRILDEAASKFPEEPLVYIKRAQSMLGDPVLLRDLLSDIDAALKRNPNDWRALRVRAAAYFDADRRREAIRDLRSVLRANPSLDDALFSVMNELLNEDRLGEAMDAARSVLDARPTDAPLMYQLGKLFESRGDWDESAEMFERAWETRRSPADGASFIDAALRVNPPDVAAANSVITDLAEMVEGGLDASPGLLAAQSLVLRARGREEFAVQQMTKAFDLSRLDEFQIQTWAQNASRFYLDLDAQSELNYYRSLRARFTDAPTRAWIDVFTAQRQIARDVSVDDALATLRRLTQDTSVAESVRVIGFRALGNYAFERDDFEGAVDAWKAGLETVPNNWELNNNAAYTLSMELGRHEEALELAERAIAAGPNRSEPYDTLAEVYIKLGRYDEAEQMIQAGEQRARNYTARVTMTITRARMAVAKGDNEEAMRLLRRARALLRTVAGRDTRLEEQIDKVEAGIGSDG